MRKAKMYRVTFHGPERTWTIVVKGRTPEEAMEKARAVAKKNHLPEGDISPSDIGNWPDLIVP